MQSLAIFLGAFDDVSLIKRRVRELRFVETDDLVPWASKVLVDVLQRGEVADVDEFGADFVRGLRPQSPTAAGGTGEGLRASR